MARPKATELTERELEIMHVFWKQGAPTAGEVREALANAGRDLAYTTVATLVANPDGERLRAADQRRASVPL